MFNISETFGNLSVCHLSALIFHNRVGTKGQRSWMENSLVDWCGEVSESDVKQHYVHKHNRTSRLEAMQVKKLFLIQTYQNVKMESLKHH